MELIYRGLKYNLRPIPFLSSESEVIAKYRGVKYQIHKIQKIEPKSPTNLTYRGVPYQSKIKNNPFNLEKNTVLNSVMS